MADERLEKTAMGPFRVLDLTDEKGQFCGKVLGDLGADVIKIERPGGDPSRRLGPFFHDIGDPEKSLWWLTLNTSKRSVTLDLETPEGQAVFKRLAQTADFVVESFAPGYLDNLGLGYEALSALNPRLILTSITPFGQTGPYRDFKSSDIVTMAMGGLMYLCGDPDRAPVRIGAPQAFLQAGAHAATGSLIAHWYRERTGLGQHVDLSMQECITLCMDTAQQYWDMGQGITKRAGGSRPSAKKIARIVYPCRDGFVGAQPIRGLTWDALVSWLEQDGMAEDLRDPAWLDRLTFPPVVEITQQEIEHLEKVIAAFLATKTKAEIFDEAQKRRIIICPVNGPADLLASPQLASRDYWTDLEHDELGTKLVYPGAPFKMSESPWRLWRRAPLIGEHNEEILSGELGLSREEVMALAGMSVTSVPRGGGRLVNSPASSGEGTKTSTPRFVDVPSSGSSKESVFAGLKIADFSWVGVGPITAKYLADHGATVVRIESNTRPETLRVNPPFRDEILGVNRSGYYANFNSSKFGVSLNLNHPQGVAFARRFAAWADVVTESFTPKAMRKWGLTYEDLRKVNPGLIMISMPLQGQTGPHAEHLGFGNVLQGLAGVTHLTGWPDRDPVGTGVAYTDFFVPQLSTAAVISALEYRRRTGKGQYIDLSQYESSVHCLGTAMLEYTANGREQVRAGNDLVAGGVPYAAPHGAYRCQGTDRWVAIAVFNDDEWQGFCQVIGNPAWTGDSRFATLEERVKHLRELDELIEVWTTEQKAEDVMHRMQAAGVPAGVVQNAQDIHNDPHLRHRGHFWRLEHPEMGECAYNGPSFRLSKTPAELTRPAPLLGQDNEYFFKDVLGLSEEEYVECLLEGVFE